MLGEPSSACPFCERAAGGEVLIANAVAVAFPDAYPLTEGHAGLPSAARRRPVRARRGCLVGLWALVRDVRQRLDADINADGWNVGVNAGRATGQTMEHAHVHVIPRRAGDVADPRGGVRWIFPDKAAYWDK